MESGDSPIVYGKLRHVRFNPRTQVYDSARAPLNVFVEDAFRAHIYTKNSDLVCMFDTCKEVYIKANLYFSERIPRKIIDPILTIDDYFVREIYDSETATLYTLPSPVLIPSLHEIYSNSSQVVIFEYLEHSKQLSQIETPIEGQLANYQKFIDS